MAADVTLLARLRGRMGERAGDRSALEVLVSSLMLVAGKVAGNAISCLPSYRSGEMVPSDNSTAAFKNVSTVYVNHLIGECSGLKSGWYTLVPRSSGPGMCRGDIADVADVRTGMVVGSCAIRWAASRSISDAFSSPCA